MGGGIAGALAGAGIDVRLRDVDVESLRVGLAGAAAPLERRVKRRRLKPRQRDEILERISPTTEATGLGRVDFVIEAVPEILELKRTVFRELEAAIPDHAFLATNTSSLPIDSIAEGIGSPERLVGLHFFNPVHRMPLVEVIPGARTRDAVLSAAVGLVRRLKKSPIVVADRPGFLVNRLLLPYLNEAALAVEDGWPVAGRGRRHDPVRDADGTAAGARRGRAGRRREGLRRAGGGLRRARPAGRHHGAAAGRRCAGREDRPRVLEGERQGPPCRTPPIWACRPPPRHPPNEEITDRLLSGMVNEAARCLAEGVVRDPDHLDLGTVLGAGFPPFRGGLRRWALSVGEDGIRRRLEGLAARYGSRFEPADELAELFR